MNNGEEKDFQVAKNILKNFVFNPKEFKYALVSKFINKI